MKIHSQLLAVQAQLKAPKGQFNNFGNYKYRSCEDILESVKPLLAEHGLTLSLSDSVQEVGGRIYVKATAYLANEESEGVYTEAFAREEETKKGMDASQITGAASSYARKYALNGLFLIDDTKDSDSTNTHGKEPEPKAAPAPAPAKEESIMDKAVNYLKAARDRQEAYESVMKHYGEKLTDAQKASLKKFVR